MVLRRRLIDEFDFNRNYENVKFLNVKTTDEYRKGEPYKLFTRAGLSQVSITFSVPASISQPKCICLMVTEGCWSGMVDVYLNDRRKIEGLENAGLNFQSREIRLEMDGGDTLRRDGNIITMKLREDATFVYWLSDAKIELLHNVPRDGTPDSWKWEKTSLFHREKFNKLFEYGKEFPKKIMEVNNVRFCCSREFRLDKRNGGTQVYVGLSKDGYERAVKRLLRDDCASLAEQEKKILNDPSVIESSHVVRYWFLSDEDESEWLFLILDLCEETLKDFVERSSLDGLSKTARYIIQHVLQGLADLHRGSKPILHRDLKPSNILRDVSGKWLLADFGVSRVLKHDVSTHQSRETGTKDWRAVESCSSNRNSNDGKVRHKKKSDIQAAGMVAFYILTKGEHPFGEEADRLRNLLDGKPVGLDNLKDPLAKDLISWMLSHDPKDRPSAQQALKHPYLQPVKQQFEILCKMGNQREIKSLDNNSDVVLKLNDDPTDWKTLMSDNALTYLCTDNNGKPVTYHYKSLWTECLRLLRNVNQHWHDRERPLPQPEAFYEVGSPEEYFTNIFPNLLVRVHKIVRACDWKERKELKEYFI